MENKYQVLCGRTGLNSIINSIQKEEVLSIGIMDTGNDDDLTQAIKWYYTNFNHGLHVITYKQHYEEMSLKEHFPDVKCIVFDNQPNLAQRANALANECVSNYFFLTRSDTDLVEFDFNSIQNLFSEKHPSVLCPIAFNKSKEVLPTIRSPRLIKKEISPLGLMPVKRTEKTLYPFFGIGIYDRALFQRLRGFDPNLGNIYWQTLDFGVKSWLLGYPVYSVDSCAVVYYTRQLLAEDISETDGVNRFYTRALCVVRKNNKSKLCRTKRMDKTVFTEEVKQKVSLYKTDFETLCNSWNK